APLLRLPARAVADGYPRVAVFHGQMVAPDGSARHVAGSGTHAPQGSLARGPGVRGISEVWLRPTAAPPAQHPAARIRRFSSRSTAGCKYHGGAVLGSFQTVFA